MSTFIFTFIRRPIFASMIILALVVVGAAAYNGLGVDRLPSVDLPTVNVRTSLPGAAPQEVETTVSEIIEEAVNTVNGIDELRSISGPGSSNVIATFRLDVDIETAAQDVRDKVAGVLRRLPENIDPPTVSKFDNDSSPVMTLALSGDLSLRELSEIADKTVKPILERGKGVGEVAIVGQAQRTINLFVDSDKIAALKLPITAVRDAVVRENSEVPGGNLTEANRESSLRTLGRLANASEFAEVVIASPNGNPIRVKDVARVEDATAEQRSVARLNGKPSVSLEIRRQSGANSIEVIEAVKENLARVEGVLPPGVKMEIIRDQSRYIYAALHEINLHLVLGSCLACLVVFAFTRSWRSVVIAGVAIPASVISTFAMMWALDFTLNSVTMLALVLMVGIVIDDAIVVLENIFRYVEEKKMPPMQAAYEGTKEIATAVLATTLSLAVIFIPVSFMSSITGRFLYQFGITAAVAVMVSLLVSLVLTPTLSGRMLAGEKHSQHGGKDGGSRGGFYGLIDKTYVLLLKGTMRVRYLAAVVGVLIVASAVPLFRATPLSYMPDNVDEGEFELRIEGPQAANFRAMDEVMKQIEADLQKMSEIRTMLSTAGGGYIGGVNQGNVYIRMAPHEERYASLSRILKGVFTLDPKSAFAGNYTQSDVMRKIGNLTRNRYPGVTVQVRPFASFNLGGGNFDIDFSISGPDLEQLAKYTNELKNRGANIPGIRNLDTTLRLDKPELQVSIDRQRSADLGVSANDIGTALRLMVGGDEEITRYLDPTTNENYDVRLRLDEQFRNRNAQVPNLYLNGKGDTLVAVENLATVVESTAPSRVDRLDRSRDARVRGTLGEGGALAEVTEKLKAEADAMQMAPGYVLSVRGAGREFERTSKEFVFAFGLSVVFMYMILASQYENLVHPLAILLSLPLSVPFALLSLWLTGTSLNLYSALGLLVLFGVVKKNAILQIDHMNQLRRPHDGKPGMERHEAIIQGNRDRLRPILMTTLTLVAGMLPLWVGIGPGAEERRAVAVVVIGGQSLALLITLLMTPVAYSILDDLAIKLRGRDTVTQRADELPEVVAPARA
jgi:hydrophobic/amphiphilic exporter-1 (mainly G- bacteria), HAE1 family